MSTFVIGYYQDHPSVIEAMYETAENEPNAKEKTMEKLNSKIGLEQYKIVFVKKLRQKIKDLKGRPFYY